MPPKCKKENRVPRYSLETKRLFPSYPVRGPRGQNVGRSEGAKAVKAVPFLLLCHRSALGFQGMKTNVGAKFEITVDGKTRGYRDTEAIALEAAQYLKSKNRLSWRPPNRR
jgi:hypothetical protein